MPHTTITGYDKEWAALGAYIAKLISERRAALPAGYEVEPQRTEYGGGCVYLLHNGRLAVSFGGGDGRFYGMEIAELNAIRWATESGPDFMDWRLEHVKYMYERSIR